MDVQGHLQMTLGNMIMQICQAHAEIDRLKSELEAARKPAAPPAEPPKTK